MKEIRNIVQAFHEADRAGKRTALATVVQVEGSAYRRAGARMLVTEDGQLTGAISGGCLEGDALRKALLAIHQGQNKLVVYDTTEEDHAHVGVQLGCNGIIQILFEPILPGRPHNPIQILERLLEERRPAVLVSLFSPSHAPHPGTCFLFTGSNITHSPEIEALRSDLYKEARAAMTRGFSSAKDHLVGDRRLTAFVEYIKPPISLVIVGAGNDAMPLAEMAAIMGWQITLVDGRANYANPVRFPKAQKIIVAKPQYAVPQIDIDDQTAILLMTHNYNYDLAALRQLITMNCPYIGSLGPRNKLDKMFVELSREGIIYGETEKSRIFGPVGLDMGAETPEEIALSIMAEIKIVLSRKNGRSLRERKSPIHSISIYKS
jgi:xanthine dehydrogenase accessory factor